jgi:hypothetical protein
VADLGLPVRAERGCGNLGKPKIRLGPVCGARRIHQRHAQVVRGHVEVDKVRLAIIIAVEVDELALVELLIHVKDGGWCGRRF